MKKTFIIIFIMLLPACMFAATRPVEGTAAGMIQAGALPTVPIKVSVDNQENTYITFDGAMPATIMFNDTLRKVVIASLTKSMTLADTSKKDGIEGIKELGDFFNMGRLHLQYSSTDKRGQGYVIATIQDEKNGPTGSVLYLNQLNVKKLIELLEKVPQTIEELKE